MFPLKHFDISPPRLDGCSIILILVLIVNIDIIISILILILILILLEGLDAFRFSLNKLNMKTRRLDLKTIPTRPLGRRLYSIPNYIQC